MKNTIINYEEDKLKQKKLAFLKKRKLNYRSYQAIVLDVIVNLELIQFKQFKENLLECGKILESVIGKVESILSNWVDNLKDNENAFYDRYLDKIKQSKNHKNFNNKDYNNEIKKIVKPLNNVKAPCLIDSKQAMTYNDPSLDFFINIEGVAKKIEKILERVWN
ncbi:MAG: hypothetical protein ACD_4C00190G0002 [uncultured bacterium (gcode 4)]|uniref:Uncharacterized protein n=1 Tax=uncultured bacterium (gcode 4) TaxID=1234023 RepID=K2FUU4_9BACT|nr:MAG: hypothetical protein ACD_4C00190G0002 [uncultured bacterium (gcode 4)]